MSPVSGTNSLHPQPLHKLKVILSSHCNHGIGLKKLLECYIHDDVLKYNDHFWPEFLII